MWLTGLNTAAGKETILLGADNTITVASSIEREIDKKTACKAPMFFETMTTNDSGCCVIAIMIFLPHMHCAENIIPQW